MLFFKVLLFASAVIIITTTLNAQDFDVKEENIEKSSGSVMFGLGLQTVFPRGEYYEQNNKVGVGLGLNFGYFIPSLPVSIGIDGMYNIHDIEDSHEAWNLPEGSGLFDVTTYYQFLSCYIMLRFQAYDEILSPYFEGIIGFNYFWTDTKITSDNIFDETEISKTVDFQDISGAYGAGCGLMFYLLKMGDDTNSPRGLLLDFNLRYLFGGKASYLKKGSKRIVNGSIVYDAVRSETDMYSARLGVCIRF